MSYGAAPHCMCCKHLDREGKYDVWLACAAYPRGIPDDIAEGHDGHTTTRGDDNGITFEASGVDTWPGPFTGVGGD